jgi:hypothetical protein
MRFHRPFYALLLLLTFHLAVSLPSDAQTRNVSFQARRDFSATGQTGGEAAGDFRGNGSKDLVITNSLSTSTVLDMVRSNGDGTFAAPVPFFTGGTAPSGVALSDINNDGKLDVVVTNSLSNTVAVLLGNGDGTLQSPRVFAVGASPTAVAVGDFNGDGKVDVVVANSSSNSLSILLGNGDGSLRPATDIPVGNQPVALVVGKFHGNGNLDIVVANAGTGQNDGSVSILAGNGNGSFQAARNILAGGSPLSIVAAELNADLFLDLAVVDTSNASVLIELGNGNGTFRTFDSIQTQPSPVGVTVGDFHGNGRQGDLAVISGAQTNVVQVFLNSGNGKFSLGFTPTFAVSQNPTAVVAADFNHDGKTDIVSASQLGDISVLLGTGFGRFVSATTFAVGNEPEYVLATDLNGDGKLDLAVANENSNTVSVLLGAGNGSFGPKLDIPVGTNPFSVAVGDLNGDQIPDLVVSNSGHFPDDHGSISILLGNGDGTYRAPRNIMVGNIPVFASVGDFNHDGKQDLAVANFVDNTVSILRGNGDGTFSAPSTLSFPPFSQILTAHTLDVDGDHNEDLVVGGGSNVWVVKGNGLGGFGEPQLIHTGFTGEFAVADFNGDNSPDLAIVDLNQQGTQFIVDVMLNNGDGTFRRAANIPVFGTFVTQVIAADLNGDGKIDLAVSGLNTLSVAVLTGNGDGSFNVSPNANFGSTVFAQSLAAGDFNRDGKSDLVVTGRRSDAPPGSAAGGVSLLVNNTQ